MHRKKWQWGRGNEMAGRSLSHRKRTFTERLPVPGATEDGFTHVASAPPRCHYSHREGEDTVGLRG